MHRKYILPVFTDDYGDIPNLIWIIAAEDMVAGDFHHFRQEFHGVRFAGVIHQGHLLYSAGRRFRFQSHSFRGLEVLTGFLGKTTGLGAILNHQAGLFGDHQCGQIGNRNGSGSGIPSDGVAASGLADVGASTTGAIGPPEAKTESRTMRILSGLGIRMDRPSADMAICVSSVPMTACLMFSFGTF